MTTPWRSLFWRLALICLTALALGALLGQPALALAIALAAVLAHTLFKLQRLQVWLRSQQLTPPRERCGVWSEVYSLLRRRGNNHRRRQQRLLILVRAFREAAEALPDGLVHLSADGQVVWFHPPAADYLGLHWPRDAGVALADLLRWSPTAVAWLQHGAAEPLTDISAPISAGTGTGAAASQRRLGFRLVGYRGEGEQLLIVRDISQMMRVEQMRRDFVANVSHELRTPLTVLHGYLDLLDPDDSPQLAPILDEMRMQTTRMTRLVEDLLTLSRLESGRPLQDERLSLANILAPLAREAAALGQDRHSSVIENGAGLDLHGSARELHSAFSNLVANAVRYTPDGGRITIAWQRNEEGGATLSVTDTGHGIPPQHLERLTERFYRVSNSRARHSGGTGLGLSIGKHVLQLHQARLEIDSTLGTGSRFACVFGPDRIREPAEPPEPTAADEPADPGQAQDDTPDR